MMHGEVKDKIQARLKRAAGQVAGVQRMVEEDRYCIDVLTQIAAARSALAKAGQILLESHVRSCVTSAFHSDDKADVERKMEEIIEIFDRQCS